MAYEDNKTKNAADVEVDATHDESLTEASASEQRAGLDNERKDDRDAVPSVNDVDDFDGDAKLSVEAPTVNPVNPEATDKLYSEKTSKKKGTSSGAHAKAAQSAYIQRSTRMRNILIVVIVLLVVLLVAIGVLGVQMFDAARDAAVQQTLVTDTGVNNTETDASDAAPTVTKTTAVPDLVSLLGHTQDEAIAALAHGAQVKRSIEVNEEGNPIKWDVQIELTEEPSDSRTGTPTVYLGIDGAGAIIQAGYSVATSSLGYGSLSFIDAITNENIIEKTLAEAGLTVSYGTAAAQLPSDKMAYSTYDSDGTTLIKEYYAFTGVGNASGVEHPWEAILTYDYSMANATGNLNDTIRTIYAYVSA